MDVDNEVLIAMVFENLSLWDKRNKFHCNRHVTDKCWKEISLKMKQDENKIRKRWRYLRDQFAVELGKIPPSHSGDEAITVYPKWPYFKPLLFLKDVVKARATTRTLTDRRSLPAHADTDVDDTQSKSDNDYSLSTSSPYNEDDDESDQPTKAAMSTLQNTTRKRKKSIKDKIMEMKKQKLNFLKEKKCRHRRIQAGNEHILFFKSLLPHVYKIPQHTLLSFRNRIQNIVEEFAYKSLPYNNRSSSI